jgi:hypothetical protein
MVHTHNKEVRYEISERGRDSDPAMRYSGHPVHHLHREVYVRYIVKLQTSRTETYHIDAENDEEAIDLALDEVPPGAVDVKLVDIYGE